jgi:hypothetical protein
MSTFSVPVKRVRAIEPHPNADAIEFAVIEGYRSIVKKGELNPGDLVVYLPEAAVLPEWLLKRLSFWDNEKDKGTLNGREGNRTERRRRSHCLRPQKRPDSAAQGVSKIRQEPSLKLGGYRKAP